MIVEFENTFFNITLNIYILSTNLIDNILAADLTAVILRLYGVAYVDTEIVRYQRTYYIPPPYIPLFLPRPISS